MTRLAAFADEISPNLPEAVDVIRSQGITTIDLRSVRNVGILDLDDRRVDEIAHQIADMGAARHGLMLLVENDSATFAESPNWKPPTRPARRTLLRGGCGFVKS